MCEHGRRARAQGQGRAGGAVAGGARRRPPRRGVGRSAGLDPPFVGRDRELRLMKDVFHATEAAGAPGHGHRDRGHRQVAARVGVREVRRRPGRRGALAPRPLPVLRRGGRVLGARRDGAHARPHRRGRAGRRSPRASSRRPSTSGRRRRASASGSTPPLRHLLGLAADRRRRPRAAVPGVAAVLRARWPSGAGRARVRGHALGRPGAARLRRVPDGVVARPPPVRRRPRPARAGRAPAPASGRRRARSRRSRSSRSPREAMGELVSTGWCPGCRPMPSRSIARRGRRGAAVCGRDGAHAARPRRDRARGDGGYRVDRRDRRPRDPRDAACAGRRAPGRAVRRGAAAGAAGRRARQDVHARRPRRGQRSGARADLRDARRPGPQGARRRPDRSALARARPVRLRAGHGAHDRPRHPRPARAQAPAPGHRRHLTLLGGDELAEVVAAHRLDAYRLLPDDPDAAELRDAARADILRAADRAASLAAPEEAFRLVTEALDLVPDGPGQAAAARAGRPAGAPEGRGRRRRGRVHAGARDPRERRRRPAGGPGARTPRRRALPARPRRGGGARDGGRLRRARRRACATPTWPTWPPSSAAWPG